MKLDEMKIYYLGNLNNLELEKFRLNYNYKEKLSDNKQIRYSFYDEKWESMHWSTSSNAIDLKNIL